MTLLSLEATNSLQPMSISGRCPVNKVTLEMGVEVLKSLPAETGLRRSQRLKKKERIDPAMVIDLVDDEIEEARSVGTVDNPISFQPMFQKDVETHSGLEKCDSMKEALRSSGIDLNAAPQATESETKFSNDKKGEIARATGIDFADPEVLAAIMDDDVVEDGISLGDANVQHAEVVDLSSSESSDEGDGDVNDDIEEEQEKIVTTLSREDAVLFAEVMKAIKEGGDLRKFKVDQLKTYLRHHGLRMVGVKFVLLSRIQEHQRIKDRGQEIYPRSSFSINCKGDVCLGDSVVFLQTVYDTPFDYGMRCASGEALGKRWVAGKVVSESYGAGKQQHTFTIEVLWSSGVQPFYCMRPVKIMGRNLYRIVTMRQPWSNEAERQTVLDEKHARGAAARAIRRSVKGLKSKGKSRADTRVHPYRRPQGAESHGTPPPTTREAAGIHNPHQGSIPTDIGQPVPLHSSIQHGTLTERTDYQTFTAVHQPGPPTTSVRGSHIQQSESQWTIERAARRARNLPPPRQHGRSFHDQRKEFQGNGNPAHNHPPPRHHGRSFHAQQQGCQGNRNPKYTQAPSRAHVPENRRIHTQRQTSSEHLPNQGQQQEEATRISCSNIQCENTGAMRCITKSCARCCARKTTKGRCQRHK